MIGDSKIDMDFETRKCTTNMRGGGVATPLYGLYRYFGSKGEVFLADLIGLDHFGLKQGMVFALYT